MYKNNNGKKEILANSITIGTVRLSIANTVLIKLKIANINGMNFKIIIIHRYKFLFGNFPSIFNSVWIFRYANIISFW